MFVHTHYGTVYFVQMSIFESSLLTIMSKYSYVRLGDMIHIFFFNLHQLLSCLNAVPSPPVAALMLTVKPFTGFTCRQENPILQGRFYVSVTCFHLQVMFCHTSTGRLTSQCHLFSLFIFALRNSLRQWL